MLKIYSGEHRILIFVTANIPLNSYCAEQILRNPKYLLFVVVLCGVSWPFCFGTVIVRDGKELSLPPVYGLLYPQEDFPLSSLLFPVGSVTNQHKLSDVK